MKKIKNSIKKYRRDFFLCITVLWMLTIFIMSAQPADNSTKTSLFVGETIASVVVPGYKHWKEKDQILLAERIDHPVRKAAHFLEYTVLGFLMTNTLCGFRKASFGNNVGTAYILGTLYAVTDEFHQLFVPGRSGQLSDVLLDSLGVLFGCLIVLVLKKIIISKVTGHRSVSTYV